jgi:hypothetical protein
VSDNFKGAVFEGFTIASAAAWGVELPSALGMSVKIGSIAVILHLCYFVHNQPHEKANNNDIDNIHSARRT